MEQETQRRILIVRLGSLGDLVHSLPVAASLKASFPHWEVDWLVESRWRPLIEGIPEIHSIIELDTLAWREKAFSLETWRALRRAIQTLEARRYDSALDLQAALKSAIACYLSGAREIIGLEPPWLKEPACGVFYTRRVAGRGGSHIVETNLALAAALGAYAERVRFPLPPGDAASLPAYLPRGELAVINPGAGWPAKVWPAERYARVCDWLAKERGLPVVLNCGPGEEDLVGQVSRACRPSKPVAYSGSIPGLIALLRRSRLMVGPDTGPVHLAAALGVPTLGLFGPTDPRRNGPYGPCCRSLRPEGAQTTHSRSFSPDLMEQISTEDVVAAIGELLARAEAGGG